MRRVFRWGLKFGATVSLLLAAAVSVLWVRSYRPAAGARRYPPAVGDVREITWRGELWAIESRHGHIRLSNDPQESAVDLQTAILDIEYFVETTHQHIGLRPEDVAAQDREWAEMDRQAKARYDASLARVVPVMRVEHSLPHTVLIAGPVLPPAALLMSLLLPRRTLRNRRRKGHCLSCGYDLRATPGCCPECGKAPKHSAA